MLKSAKRAATSAILSGFALVLCATQSFGFEQPKYDRKIEAAAMAIVATKIGDIRGSVGQEAALTKVETAANTPWVPEQGVDDMVTGPVAAKVDQAAAKPAQQVAVLGPVRDVTKPARRVSSFVYF